MIRPIFFLFPIFVLACGKKDCDALEEGDEQDWCRYELVVKQAEDGELDAAIVDIRKMTTPMVRAAAIDKLIAISPQGLAGHHAKTLCSELPSPHRDACVRTWSRPHLWAEQ